jgi:hypothetical protein
MFDPPLLTISLQRAWHSINIKISHQAQNSFLYVMSAPYYLFTRKINVFSEIHCKFKEVCNTYEERENLIRFT